MPRRPFGELGCDDPLRTIKGPIRPMLGFFILIHCMSYAVLKMKNRRFMIIFLLLIHFKIVPQKKIKRSIGYAVM